MEQNKIFLKVITQYIGEEITNKHQVRYFETDGKELEKICEDYFLNKLEHSGLKHFSSGEKAKYILIGFVIGAVSLLITSLLIAATIYIE